MIATSILHESYVMPIHGWAGLVFVCILLFSLFKLRSDMRKDIPGDLRSVMILRWPSLNLGVCVLSLTIGLSATVSDMWFVFYATTMGAKRGFVPGFDSLGSFELMRCVSGLYGGLYLFTAGFLQYGLFSWLANKSRETRIICPKRK